MLPEQGPLPSLGTTPRCPPPGQGLPSLPTQIYLPLPAPTGAGPLFLESCP